MFIALLLTMSIQVEEPVRVHTIKPKLTDEFNKKWYLIRAFVYKDDKKLAPELFSTNRPVNSRDFDRPEIDLLRPTKGTYIIKLHFRRR